MKRNNDDSDSDIEDIKRLRKNIKDDDDSDAEDNKKPINTNTNTNTNTKKNKGDDSDEEDEVNPRRKRNNDDSDDSKSEIAKPKRKDSTGLENKNNFFKKKPEDEEAKDVVKDLQPKPSTAFGGTSGGFGSSSGGGGGFGSSSGGGGFGGSSGGGGFGSSSGGGGFGSSSGGKFGGGSGGMGRGGPITCNYCKQEGHMIRDCPTKPDRGDFRGRGRGGRGGFRGGGDRSDFNNSTTGGGFGSSNTGGGGFGSSNTGGGFGGFNNKQEITTTPTPNINPETKVIETEFYRNNKELVDCIKKVFELPQKNIEELLKQAYHVGYTIFELINSLRKEEICHNGLKETFIPETLPGSNNNNEMREEDIHPPHKEFLDTYKTTPGEFTELEDSNVNKKIYYKDFKEKRRLVTKDPISLKYNYYPVMSKQYADAKESPPDDCKYSINLNELHYHPLVYKTKICRVKKCEDALCYKSHGIESDFRIIYPYYDDIFIELCNNIERFDRQKKLKKYTDFIEFPTMFMLNNFKVNKCANFSIHNKCVDRHLCYNYHMDAEKRRPPLLFRYSSELCPNIFHDKDTIVSKLCKNGDFCTHAHGLYERNYHESAYKKMTKCTKNKNLDGTCVYEETCYCYHDEASNTKSKEFLNDTLNKFRCRGCDQLPKPQFKYVIPICCGKPLCYGCCTTMMKSEEKLCIICDKKLDKNSLTKVSFEDK